MNFAKYIELAKFTSKYFFSDETISGKGMETYTSRNGKKDYPNPKLELDTKIATNKKVKAYINFADVTIVSDEITNEIVEPPTVYEEKKLSDKWQRNNFDFRGIQLKSQVSFLALIR